MANTPSTSAKNRVGAGRACRAERNENMARMLASSSRHAHRCDLSALGARATEVVRRHRAGRRPAVASASKTRATRCCCTPPATRPARCRRSGCSNTPKANASAWPCRSSATSCTPTRRSPSGAPTSCTTTRSSARSTRPTATPTCPWPRRSTARSTKSSPTCTSDSTSPASRSSPSRTRRPTRRRRVQRRTRHPPRHRRRRTFPMGAGDGGYCLFLGRMSPDKGPHRAIAAAEKAGVPLLMAAKMREAWEVAYFDEYVKPHLNDTIRYLGEVPHEQKLELLAGATALLNPIRWNEPFGLVMIEALACGTPVLAFAEGAAPEIVERRRDRIPVRRRGRMADDIGRAATLDRGACRAAVENYFSTKRMVDEHIELFESMLSRDDRRYRREARPPRGGGGDVGASYGRATPATSVASGSSGGPERRLRVGAGAVRQRHEGRGARARGLGAQRLPPPVPRPPRARAASHDLQGARTFDAGAAKPPKPRATGPSGWTLRTRTGRKRSCIQRTHPVSSSSWRSRPASGTHPRPPASRCRGAPPATLDYVGHAVAALRRRRAALRRATQRRRSRRGRDDALGRRLGRVRVVKRRRGAALRDAGMAQRRDAVGFITWPSPPSTRRMSLTPSRPATGATRSRPKSTWACAYC